MLSIFALLFLNTHILCTNGKYIDSGSGVAEVYVDDLGAGKEIGCTRK